MEEGDVAIMDPMMMHTAMPMRHPGQSRYVASVTPNFPFLSPVGQADFFRGGRYATFFDASAAGPVLLPTRGATEPSSKYPPEFVAGLAANGLEGLVDWEVPADSLTQSRRMRAEWGLAGRL